MEMSIELRFVVTLCLVEACTFTVHNKAASIGFVYKTIKDMEWFSCIIACQEDLACISYHFCVVEDHDITGTGTCSLNNCNLNDPCSNEASLIWTPGCRFQQLENRKATCDHKRLLRNEETGVVKASLSCKDSMKIYVDGRQETDMMNCKKFHQFWAYNFTILPTAQLIAIEVESVKKPYVIGSFSDGIVTNSSWKCTSGTELNWQRPGLNDSLWKSAVEHCGSNKESDEGYKKYGVRSHGARWITSADDGQQNMYCRLNRFV